MADKPIVFYTRADGKPIVFYPKYSLLTYFKLANIAVRKTANVVSSNMSAVLQILKQITESTILAKPTKSFAKFTPTEQEIIVTGMSTTGTEAATENVPPQGPTATKNVALITTPTDLEVTSDIETSYTTEIS
jgi:hypothetical protein